MPNCHHSVDLGSPFDLVIEQKSVLTNIQGAAQTGINISRAIPVLKVAFQYHFIGPNTKAFFMAH